MLRQPRGAIKARRCVTPKLRQSIIVSRCSSQERSGAAEREGRGANEGANRREVLLRSSFVAPLVLGALTVGSGELTVTTLMLSVGYACRTALTQFYLTPRMRPLSPSPHASPHGATSPPPTFRALHLVPKPAFLASSYRRPHHAAQQRACRLRPAQAAQQHRLQATGRLRTGIHARVGGGGGTAG